jgi:hypothetical protein
MQVKFAATAFALGVAWTALATPARAQSNAAILAQCRAIYEDTKRAGTAATDKPAIGTARAEKSEAEKSTDPLHGKSWLEFAAGCRAYYLDKSLPSADSTGRGAKDSSGLQDRKSK